MIKISKILVHTASASLIAVLAVACTAPGTDRPIGQQEPVRETKEPEHEAWSLLVLTLDMGHSAYTLTVDGSQKRQVAPHSKLVGNLLLEVRRDAIVTTNPATGEQVHKVLLDKEFHAYEVYGPLIDFCPSLATAFFVDGGWLYRHKPEDGTSRVLYLGDIGAGTPIYGADNRFEVSSDGAYAAVVTASTDRIEDNTARDNYGDVIVYDLVTHDLLTVMYGEQCYWLSNDVLVVVDMSDEIATHQWHFKLWSKEKGVFLEETIDRMSLAIGQGEFSIIESGETLSLHRRSLDGSAIGVLKLPVTVEVPSQGIVYYSLREQ